MIYHYLKDGTRIDNVDGYIVEYEQKIELYKRLHKRTKEVKKEILVNEHRKSRTV